MKNQELVNLKRRKTRLLNTECKSETEFELVQDLLNEIELKMQLIHNRD